MKKLLTISFLALLVACGGKKSETAESGNILENLTYTVDTVVVDAGEDFLNLGFGLGTFDLTADQSQLLFFENKPLNLVKVDLDQLKVLSKAEFESEGPNSVGQYLRDLKVGPSQEIFIKGFNAQGIFTNQGKLTEELRVFPEGIDPEYANDFMKLYGRAIYDFEMNRLFAQPSTEITKRDELLVIDPAANSFMAHPIPKMKSVGDLSILFTQKSDQGTSVSYFGPSAYMEVENGQLLISGGTMSGLYRLKGKNDSIEFIDIHHSIAPDEWNISVTNESTDEGTFMEDRRKIAEQLNYMDFRWDDKRELFLRLGKRTFLGENRGDPSTYELYLFAYDKDFNVLGETKIEGLERIPSSYFWKDGKLWSYANVEDELGFAVFTFDF